VKRKMTRARRLMPLTAPMAVPTIVAALAEPPASPLTVAAAAADATVFFAGPVVAASPTTPAFVVLEGPIASRGTVLLVVVEALGAT